MKLSLRGSKLENIEKTFLKSREKKKDRIGDQSLIKQGLFPPTVYLASARQLSKGRKGTGENCLRAKSTILTL